MEGEEATVKLLKQRRDGCRNQGDRPEGDGKNKKKKRATGLGSDGLVSMGMTARADGVA